MGSTSHKSPLQATKKFNYNSLPESGHLCHKSTLYILCLATSSLQLDLILSLSPGGSSHSQCLRHASLQLVLSLVGRMPALQTILVKFYQPAELHVKTY